MKCIPKCKRPTEPGVYICLRENVANHELVIIRYDNNNNLYYIGGISVFPLNKLEQAALFWGPIELE
jgi:hypothetical protein